MNYLELWIHNPLLHSLSYEAIKEIKKECNIVKLYNEEYLFKDGDPKTCLYLLLSGIKMLDKNNVVFGIIKSGEFVGEEVLMFGDWKTNSRIETAISFGESILIEFSIGAWKKLKDVLGLVGLKWDFFVLMKAVETIYSRKKTWRSSLPIIIND